MKKKTFALCLCLLLLLSLAACGGSAKGGDSANQAASSAPMDAVDMNTSSNFDMPAGSDGGWDAAVPEEAPAPSPEGGYGGAGNVPANAKIIYTADMDLETKDFEAASQSLSDLVEELGGYFESRNLNQGGYYRSLSCTVRVPAANFSAFLERAGETAHLTNRSDYQENVSEAYYDQEARLTTQRTKLERLQELLSKAENMEDIITIESAISETELQIEYLTGSLRKYDSLIDYATVNISLYEVYRLSTDEEVPVTFGQRLASAFSTGFQRGVDGLEDFAISAARNWVTLLILAVLAAAVILLLRRRSRKRSERYAAQVLPKMEKAEKKTSEDKKED